MGDITVITTAIPKRYKNRMLEEALASVYNQQLRPHAHLIHIDYEGVGTVASLNRLLAGVETEFVNTLSDDDYFYPQHLRVLRAAIGDADVCYSWCDCGGEIPHTDDGSSITAAALVRTSALRECGGWWQSDSMGDSQEDFRMWEKIQLNGGKFVCVPEITRRYRFHGDNQSRDGIKGIL